MMKPVLTSSQAAQLLGVSRQHVADLADRGELASWRAGSHRRFRREDVDAYLAGLQGATKQSGRLSLLNLTDRRSLGYGLLIAAKLVAQPELVIGLGLKNLARLRAVHSDGSADYFLDCWDELLGGPPDTLFRVLTSTDEESIALRHTAPFAGLLSDEERREVIRATRAVA
jgi:excisionase family DNA binding protein